MYFLFIFQITSHKINQVIVWITPTNREEISLNKLGLPIQKGFGTKRNLNYTIKISKTGILNIYIKRPITKTLKGIHNIIFNFYKFATEKTGYKPNGFNIKITNVQGSFQHSLKDLDLYDRIKYLRNIRNITFVELKEATQFTYRCKCGLVTFLSKRGTIICKDLIEYKNFFNYLLQQDFI